MNETLLAQGPTGVQQIFGTIKAPGPGLSDPGTGISQLLVGGIQLAFFIAALLLLGYLFYGAFLYITSGGDEEKTTAARNTMTYAVLGMILMVVGLSIFAFVAGNILGIIQRDEKGNIYFKLPTIGGQGGGTPGGTVPANGAPGGTTGPN